MKPNNVLAKPQMPRFDQPSRYSLIQPLGDDIFPFDAPPFPSMPAPYDEGLQLATTLERTVDGLYERADATQRAVIFGGHDMWQKPMKEFLTGNVRFIDRDMAAFDTDIIRYADAIWIQTNAIPHKLYYKIMDAVRKWKIPVKYFLYASARKCAEQIVLEERE